MLKSLSILFLGLTGFFRLISCQIPFAGRCPNVELIPTFDLDRYMGLWYHYTKYIDLTEEGSTCHKELWQHKENNDTSYTIGAVLEPFSNLFTATYTAKVIAPGKVIMKEKKKDPEIPNYFILGTDYNNWAVVYNCIQRQPNYHIRYLRVMTRTPQISKEATDAVISIMKKNNLSGEFYIKLEHPTTCPNIVNRPDVKPFQNIFSIFDTYM